jgi:predicted ester cyclase
MESIDIMHFAEGKLVEHWGQGDVVGLMQQLGAVVPPTAQTVR